MTSLLVSTPVCQALATETRLLPNCFADHRAPQSVVELFTAWVYAADETLNGVIVVNRQRQRYGRTTTSKAISWLVKHRLMMKVEQGGGRGVGSRYFIRWSFNHETLTQRRRAAYAEINAEKPAGYRITGHPSSYVEERHTSEKHSLNTFKTTDVVSPVENSKRDGFRAENEQKRRLRNEKATRWALAQLRKVSDDEDALTAAARSIRRSLATGAVFIGPEFNRFVGSLADDLENLSDGEMWPETRRDVFSFIGFGAWSVVLRIYGDRRNEAEYQQREREREEARLDPLPADFDFMAFYEATKATPPASVSRQEHTPNVTRRGVATRPKPGEKSGYQRIQAERAKAADDLSQLLREEGVGSVSALIRRQVNAEGTPQPMSRGESGSQRGVTGGAVVRSHNCERRQREKAYQRAKDLQGALYGEHAALVYGGEPVSIAGMISGFLERLGGDDHAMERKDGIETANGGD